MEDIIVLLCNYFGLNYIIFQCKQLKYNIILSPIREFLHINYIVGLNEWGVNGDYDVCLNRENSSMTILTMFMTMQHFH